MLGDAATTVDGVLLMGLGADMEVPGLALDATGIGAPAEVAMNAAGLVVMAAGGASLVGGVRRFRRRRQQLATAAPRPAAP